MRLFPVALFALAQTLFAYIPTSDGLYAVFETNKGEFAAKLYFEKAPITVANFVGLAEGSIIRWDDEDEVPIYGKFYDGITFHRVVKGFVIQGGSPNGLGTDGPGYYIPDEMDPTLSHSKAGILSMANSGPNSGGSQFFITLAATTSLDGQHAVFGEIVDGMANVTAIGNVAVDASDKPTSSVVISHIKIIRKGAAALGFNPRNLAVPNVLFPKLDLNVTETTMSVTFPRRSTAFYAMRKTSDFSSWTALDTLPSGPDVPASHTIDVGADFTSHGKAFVEVLEVTGNPLVDANGHKVTISFANNSPIEITFGASNAGTYKIGTSSGTAIYNWRPLDTRDQLHISYTPASIPPMQVYFTWTSATGGSVFAFVYQAYYDQFGGYHKGYPLSGTFTADGRPGDD